jgi:hypothetical protein
MHVHVAPGAEHSLSASGQCSHLGALTSSLEGPPKEPNTAGKSLLGLVKHVPQSVVRHITTNRSNFISG